MTRIRIGGKELDVSISAKVEPGSALLVGRAPDPDRIDWSLLVPQQTPCSLMSPRVASAHYRVETVAVQSGQISANHLLVLRDGAVTALYDLGSRNGSWVRLGPRRPVVISAGDEISICLAGTPALEPRPLWPKDAEWTQEADFAVSVERALSTWLQQIMVPMRVTLRPPGSTDGFLLADSSLIELQECGTLPVPSAKLLEIVSEYIHTQNARFKQIGRRASGMVAASAAIKRILLQIAEGAASSRRTIILGSTGVGKELLARSYHGYSPRHAGPFVTVNCALLEKDLLYAQLFGARRGSFTGAVSDVVGLIEAANGGTLFLDELGEMSLEVQKALLRFLDSRGEYYRLGESRARQADVQLVCASNAPLDDPAYRSLRFRDDLWYRLAALVMAVPPLCERPEDIRGFLESHALHGSKWPVPQCLTEEALALVLSDPWPGNFRDLENFIGRLPAVSRPCSIDRQRCEAAIREGRPRAAPPPPAAPPLPSVPAPRDAAAAPPPIPSRESPSRVAGKPLGDFATATNATLGWEQIVQTALAAFLEDHGEQPTGWAQLLLFVERYLKPMFVAHAAALTEAPDIVRVVNYSALARRLHIGDGGTVKTHLTRFADRFGKSALIEKAAAGGSTPVGSD